MTQSKRLRLAMLGPGLAAMVLTAPTIGAPVQTTGDPVDGRHVAEVWCSNCHVVGPSQTAGSSNGAPPFAAIAQMTSTTPTSLEVFLQTSHDRMPDLRLSREQIADVAAYILSLRKP